MTGLATQKFICFYLLVSSTAVLLVAALAICSGHITLLTADNPQYSVFEESVGPVAGFETLDNFSDINLHLDDHLSLTSAFEPNDEDRKAPCAKQLTCNQTKRFDKLQEMCTQFPELSTSFEPDLSSTYSRMFVNDKHKVLYCVLPKAASTTFNNMFYYSIKGQILEDTHCRSCWKTAGLKFLNLFPAVERKKRIENYYKVMVVRHPLDRLVSCWNNKFVPPNLHNVWTMHGHKLIDFIRKTNSSRTKDLGKGATFVEFVKYVIHLETLGADHNDHWRPHYRMCHPCNIDYDLIVKLETMDDDIGAMMKLLDLQDSEFPILNKQRPVGNDTFHRTIKEYEQIAQDDLEKLKKMYKYDMKLFNYKWNDGELKASCGNTCEGGDDCC